MQIERNLANEFNEITKNVIAPELKISGFKKKGLNFNRAINGIVQSINIQKSHYNHAQRLIFTINIGFYCNKIFEISKNKSEQPQFITTNNCFLWGRSGHLIYGQDKWYELNFNKNNYEDVLHQLEKDLKLHIVPLFTQLLTLDSIIEILRLNIKDRPFHLISSIYDMSILELEFGDFKIGKDILENEYKEAIIPKSTKHTTVYPDGSEDVRWSEPSVNDFIVEHLKRIAKYYNIQL